MAQSMTEASLRSWMERLGPRLLRISAGICRDRHQAEEVVQEAFVKLWRSPPDAGEVAYASWLRRVVTNLSINALQRTRRPQALPEFSADPALRSGNRPEREVMESERLLRVRRAMERLDPAKRTILILRAYEELSYEEIAAHLGVPVGTVMSRLNRARTALSEEMEREAAGGPGAEEDVPDVLPFRRFREA